MVGLGFLSARLRYFSSVKAHPKPYTLHPRHLTPPFPSLTHPLAPPQGKIGYDSGGYVAFELVEPLAYYGGCSKNAPSEVPVPEHRHVGKMTFTSMNYEWYTWQRADRQDNIAR